MTTPTFGVSIQPTNDEAQAPIWSDFSVVAMIGTAPDADATVYPLDTPVLVYTNETEKLAKLGLDGSLLPALMFMKAQLGGGAAKVVVLRIADGGTPLETVNNAVGDGISTGINALLDAGPLLGVTPRIVVAPGLCGIRASLGEANALTAALPPILDKLLAHAIVDTPGVDEANDLDWRESHSHMRLIPVAPAVIRTDGGEQITVPASAGIAGLAVYVDNLNGGLPFRSWANRPIQGMEKLTRTIRFDFFDGANEGQTLLANNIGIIVRSERGVDGQGQGGFIYVGTDNLADDPLWRFYNVSRGRDYINNMVRNTVSTYLGRYSLTGQTVQAILTSIRMGLDQLIAQNMILDAEVSFNAVDNSTAELRQGNLTVQFRAEETPVIRRVTVKSGRMVEAVNDLISDLAAL